MALSFLPLLAAAAVAEAETAIAAEAETAIAAEAETQGPRLILRGRNTLIIRIRSGGYTYISYPAFERHMFFNNAVTYYIDGADIETTSGSASQSYPSAGELFRFQANNGSISRMTIIDGGDSDVHQFNFDSADGGTIDQSLGSTDDAFELFYESRKSTISWSSIDTRQSNVGGIARSFFGVGRQPHWNYSREVIAFHGGQPADDAVVPNSGTYEFQGYSAGHWMAPDRPYWTTSDIEVSVNFSNLAAQLTSSNTLKIEFSSPDAWSYSSEAGLDFSVDGRLSSNPKSVGAFTTDSVGDVLPNLGLGAADGGEWRAYFYERRQLLKYLVVLHSTLKIIIERQLMSEHSELGDSY